jgi:flagellar biosynthesis protein FlhF
VNQEVKVSNMSPQVFRGRNVVEAHRAAIEKLGPEAVVLTTRTVARSGIAGWFGGSQVELAATRPVSGSSEPAPVRTEGRFAPGVYAADRAPRTTHSDVAALRAELKGDLRSLKTMLVKSGDSADLAAEIAQLREVVEGLAKTKPTRDKAATQLQALGIEGQALQAIARPLRGKSCDAAAVREEIGRALQSAGWPIGPGPAMIALVGPSGVGKTTTAAKLAARARMDGKTVTLVACDTYRVGAVEQLSQYAELMGAQIATARTSEELRAIVDGATTDLVIVDTSGRPPSADGVEIALAPRRSASKTAGRARHVLLCVPASVRSHDAARIAKRFGVLAPTSLVVTKIDETDAPAGIVHASWASKLPISVVCFGQRVPEDIAPATVATLVDYVAPLPTVAKTTTRARRVGEETAQA